MIVGGTRHCAGPADGSDFAFALDTESGRVAAGGRRAGSRKAASPRRSPPMSTACGNYIQLARGDVARVAAKDGTVLWKVDVASNPIAIIPLFIANTSST
jgi:hypothetical protein